MQASSCKMNVYDSFCHRRQEQFIFNWSSKLKPRKRSNQQKKNCIIERNKIILSFKLKVQLKLEGVVAVFFGQIKFQHLRFNLQKFCHSTKTIRTEPRAKKLRNVLSFIIIQNLMLIEKWKKHQWTGFSSQLTCLGFCSVGYALRFFALENYY